ncbi:MAG: hypothetical protein O3C05_00445 [Proteobacteria bacterium]|nr:hypothetical protein [Pseudomonadota bacterium]
MIFKKKLAGFEKSCIKEAKNKPYMYWGMVVLMMITGITAYGHMREAERIKLQAIGYFSQKALCDINNKCELSEEVLNSIKQISEEKKMVVLFYKEILPREGYVNYMGGKIDYKGDITEEVIDRIKINRNSKTKGEVA